MSNYRNVLVAIDLNPDNQPVIDKAVEVCEMNAATLHVIHVVEPLSYGYSDGMMSWSDGLISVEAAIREDARKKLSEMGAKCNVDDDRLYFRTGRASSEIHDVVEEKEIDLIVIGTHGQAGLQLLLGSTANSVLHGLVCDVLAVRIKEA
jgi:universal stress protein A